MTVNTLKIGPKYILRSKFDILIKNIQLCYAYHYHHFYVVNNQKYEIKSNYNFS